MSNLQLVLLKLVIITFLTSCSANVYFERSYYADPDFKITGHETVAIPSLVSTDTLAGPLSTEIFLNSIPEGLFLDVERPGRVDSLLYANGVYALPNQLPKPLIADLRQFISSRFFLVGYILGWEDACIGQNGYVKHRVDIYDLHSGKLAWRLENEVLIDAPDEDEEEGIYFIGSCRSAYEKLARKTLVKLMDHNKSD